MEQRAGLGAVGLPWHPGNHSCPQRPTVNALLTSAWSGHPPCDPRSLLGFKVIVTCHCGRSLSFIPSCRLHIGKRKPPWVFRAAHSASVMEPDSPPGQIPVLTTDTQGIQLSLRTSLRLHSEGAKRMLEPSKESRRSGESQIWYK